MAEQEEEGCYETKRFMHIYGGILLRSQTMILYKDKEITVRTLEDEDADFLVKWLSDPRVLAYYEGRDRPHDLAMVRQHFYDRTQDHTACLIEYEGQPIGYIQYYLISEEDIAAYGYEDIEGKIYGMDQFIGETDYWNKGIGTALIKSMVHYLTTAEEAIMIIMDPQVWNERALRVYEKCGFRRKKLLPAHEWHEGQYRDCWLIEYRNDSKQ